jgi:hypothetical protein
MRKYILAITLLLVSGSLFAFCGSNVTLACGAVDNVSGLSDTPANIGGFMWIQGQANWTEGSGIDSDGVGVVNGTCYDLTGLVDHNACSTSIAGNYMLDGDWSTITWDGCPTAAGTNRACFVLYDNTGKYTLQSKLRSEDWSYWEQVMGTVAAAIPTFENRTGGTATRTGGTTANITFPAIPASVYNGTYDTAVPASAVATGYKVYAWQGASGPTTISISGGWVACNGGAVTPIATNALVGITIPAAVGGQGIVFSRSLVFEGKELPFVSNSILPLTGEIPSGAPVISSINAVNAGLNTNVNWTSSDETQVTGYQIFWAPVGGEFTAIGSRVSPAGNDHTYTASVRIPSTSGYSVKVGAYLTSGDVEYSAAAVVKSATIIKDKTRINVN